MSIRGFVAGTIMLSWATLVTSSDSSAADITAGVEVTHILPIALTQGAPRLFDRIVPEIEGVTTTVVSKVESLVFRLWDDNFKKEWWENLVNFSNQIQTRSMDRLLNNTKTSISANEVRLRVEGFLSLSSPSGDARVSYTGNRVEINLNSLNDSGTFSAEIGGEYASLKYNLLF